jgi:hypothetical protein
MKLNVKAFSFAIMIFYGAIIFIFSIWHSLTGFGKEFLKMFESIHPSFITLDFSPAVSMGKSFVSNIGAVLINTVWAVIDGLIIGVCITGLHNWLIKKDMKEETPAEDEKEN